MVSDGLLRRWRWAGATEPAACDGEAAQRLASRLGVRPMVAHLLLSRGLSDDAAAGPFLDPKLTHLHDPALLPGLSDAAERLAKAVRDGQPIVIYGDYDVDGVTASAILYHVLKLAGATVSTYVPHRVDEGYGLNSDALLELGRRGEQQHGRTPLVVSVDCGITATEPAAAAKQAGIELIITDHHEFDASNLPDAAVLVHPRLVAASAGATGGSPASAVAPETSPYPFGYLCGAGVAFKLAWQFAKMYCGAERLPKVFRDLMIDLLALAALGTVADIVPLIDENRVITRFGLGQMKRTRFVGLNALIDAAKLRGEPIDTFHVGFILGPRLNACGRMGDAADAVRLLTTEDEAEAKQLAEHLTNENERRRDTEKLIAEAAIEMAQQYGYDREDHRAIVVGCEGWHQGVIGIVASRLVERFHRPTVMLTYDNGDAHGSARSVNGVSIHEALRHCAKHLTTFGGHDMAAGLRLKTKNVDAFREDLVAFVNERLSPAELTPELHIDADCMLTDVDFELMNQLRALAPFGRDNAAPVLSIHGLQLAAHASRVGQSGQHLRLNLRHDRRVVQAIGWRMGDLCEQLPAGQRVDVAFEPKINTWGGMKRVDLHLKDVRLAT